MFVYDLSFFKNLYTAGGGCFRGFEGVDWSPINETMADWLVKLFEVAEVTEVVFSCDGNKFPGLDGFFLKF